MRYEVFLPHVIPTGFFKISLMPEISKKLAHIKGLRFRQLYICKSFYLAYPHFLRTASAKLQQVNIEDNTILRTLSAKSIEEKRIAIEKSAGQDSDLQLAPELLLSRLTFSHSSTTKYFFESGAVEVGFGNKIIPQRFRNEHQLLNIHIFPSINSVHVAACAVLSPRQKQT
jgi:hypothetical protein